MPKYQSLDSVFHALANPARRAVLERLGEGPTAVSDLAEPFDMALPSFMQHLKVLEDSGLVRSRKVGRVRRVEAVVEPLQAAEDWMAKQRRLWNKRLDQLDEYVIAMKEKGVT
jgi:DNA-binding transcriptional ArsR family regulator